MYNLAAPTYVQRTATTLYCKRGVVRWYAYVFGLVGHPLSGTGSTEEKYVRYREPLASISPDARTWSQMTQPCSNTAKKPPSSMSLTNLPGSADGLRC